MLAAAAVYAAEPPRLTPAGREAQIASFEYVWKTVREKHWDPKLNGIDWQRVHDELRPKIERAKTAAEARGIISAMLARLRQSHFGIIPAEAYRETMAGGGPRDGAPGIDVRLIGGRVLVTSVEKDSPAAGAGIRPGWEVLAIDNTELSRVVSRIRKDVSERGMQPLLIRASVLHRLSGAPGTKAALRLRNGANQVVRIETERVKPRGAPTQFGFLPLLYVWSEFRRLEGGAGYLRFNMFMDPDRVMKTAADGVSSCLECRGFIIDLRGNPGGIGGMAMGLAGWFVDAKGRKLGTMLTRDTRLNFIIIPRPVTYRGPVAILVDEATGSTAEIFSGGMKDIGRARIFGARTAGAALPSVIEKLANGDGFQYAFANYVSESGKPLEGSGVLPDMPVEPTRESLLAGGDAALEAALAWIGKQSQESIR